MSRKPTKNIDYTSKDYEAYRDLLIKKLQELMPEYTDTSETDAGIVIIEALANGLDIISLYADIVANDMLLPTTQDRGLAIILARCLGYTPYNQTASIYPQVFVLDKIREEDVVIPKGTIVKTPDSPYLTTFYFETLEDFVIPKGKLGNEKEKDKYLYTVNVQNGESIYQDVIGTSTGATIQSFRLNFTKVLVDTLEVYVDEGQGQQLWKRVDSFLEYNENSKVYMVSVDDFDVCSVIFGNGLKGKIPLTFPNGITANYRIGGGEETNVSPNTITELKSSVAHIESTFNLEPLVLGHDKEPLESIKENAPATYRTRNRLVILEDYEDLLRINFYDLLRVKAIRDENNKRMVHLFYILRDGYKMDSELLTKIDKFIKNRCMIGTDYDINEYVKQLVNIKAKLYVNKDFNAEKLKKDIETYIKQVTFFYGELLFDDSIIKSELENEIRTTFKGVLSFRINLPSSDIISPKQVQNILTLGTIDIDVEQI